MKRYIKSQNYINLDDEIQTLIDEFDPYIDDYVIPEDTEAIGHGWVNYLIKDRNSDFGEWIDAEVDEDGNILQWDWNRQVFFDRSYTDDMNIKRILEDESVSEKVEDILLNYEEAPYEERDAY